MSVTRERQVYNLLTSVYDLLTELRVTLEMPPEDIISRAKTLKLTAKDRNARKSLERLDAQVAALRDFSELKRLSFEDLSFLASVMAIARTHE